MLMAGEYYRAFGERDIQNWKVVSAEQGFGLRREVPLGENSLVRVFYVGKPDLSVFTIPDDQYCPVEHKTRHRIDFDVQARYKPHSQTTGYIFSSAKIVKDLGIDRPVDRCIVNVAARERPSDNPKDGKKKPRFARVYVAYSAEELEEWRLSILDKVTRMRHAIEHGDYLWREASCHLYRGCEFRRVDSAPPGARNIILEADFQKAEPWAPYEVEEDD
jgi:hypothetical protein